MPAAGKRAQIMDAVLTQIQNMSFNVPINGATTWRRTGNRLSLWTAVPADQQPAAFLVSHREVSEYRNLGLLRRRLELQVWCYSRSDNTPGQPDLDIMMDAFESQFAVIPDNFSTNQLTFAGLAYWCRVEGRTFKDPGDIDFQTLLIVPIVVEMP